MLDVVKQVVRILALEAVIEGERFQCRDATSAHPIGSRRSCGTITAAPTQSRRRWSPSTLIASDVSALALNSTRHCPCTGRISNAAKAGKKLAGLNYAIPFP
jgi:hypothetical protein